MRTVFRALPVLLILLSLAAAPAAFAEGEMKPAPYSVEFLVPGEETPLEGWSIKDDATPPAGAPTEAQLTALGEAVGLDEDVFYVEYRVIEGSAGRVALGLIDVDTKVAAFRQALDPKAAEHGWRVSELGSPTRLLVLAGGEAACAAFAKDFRAHCIYALSEMGMNRLRGNSGFQEEGRKAALEYTDAIARLAPDAGTGYAVRGVVLWIEAQPKKRGEKPDEETRGKAAAAFAKSLADGVPFPPKGSVRVFVAGELGQILLEKKDKSLLDQATRALEDAVENERDGKNNVKRFGNRYNLACAYARKNRIKEAFEMLEGALEVGKNLPPDTFRANYENINEKDPDMAPLRADPRFSELMSRFKPPPKKERRMPRDGNHPDPDAPKDPHHPGGKPDAPKDPHHPGGKPDMPKDPHHPGD